MYQTVSTAHEVYVLDPETIRRLENLPPVSYLDIFYANVGSTLIWGSLIGFMIISVFLISISATLENAFDGYLVKLKKFASFIARITIGLAFIVVDTTRPYLGPSSRLMLYLAALHFSHRAPS